MKKGHPPMIILKGDRALTGLKTPWEFLTWVLNVATGKKGQLDIGTQPNLPLLLFFF